ncbi:hypothetical protein BDAP_000274 [Binucleata daphniae]
MSTHFTFYPIYIDASKSHNKGRKFPMQICLETPKFEELNEAFKRMEINVIPEPSKRHPKDPFLFGRFKVPKLYGKKMIVNGLKEEVENLRKEKIEKEKELEKQKLESLSSGKSGYIKNDLNLVPRKKKKGKKGK